MSRDMWMQCCYVYCYRHSYWVGHFLSKTRLKGSDVSRVETSNELLHQRYKQEKGDSFNIKDDLQLRVLRGQCCAQEQLV